MSISEKMNQALNHQVTNELGASHAYLAMSQCFERMGLKIFAKRFFNQAEEERGHALKIIKYVQDVEGAVKLGAIPEPRGDYPSAEAIVEAALESERGVTGQVNELVALAETEHDYSTRSFLQWFLDEQVEEVASMHEMLQLVRMAGEGNLLLVEPRIEEKPPVT